MARRRGLAGTVAASPTMVGAVTVMVVILAVFLAYNANTGLPFVPTYRVSAELRNAEALVPGNEVRIGGVRVGAVEAVTPQSHSDGTVTARLDLALGAEVEPLPVATRVTIRQRSALGLKYLELDPGEEVPGEPVLAEGATIPTSATRPEPVELDEVLRTFDEPTRLAIQRNLTEYGSALAGRGPSLNATLGELPALLARLERVAGELALPGNELGRFVESLAALAGEVADVAEPQARLVASLARTFEALASVSRPYVQEAISESPATLGGGIRDLPTVRPLLEQGRGLMVDLAPGMRALRESGGVIARALAAGPQGLAPAPLLNAELAPTARALVAFGADPGARRGVARLTQTASILAPTLRFVAPAQSVCNYATLFARNAASIFELGDRYGTWQRFIVFDPPKGPDSEGSPSRAPASGPSRANHLHINPYPNTASPGQPRECEAGNEPYLAGETVIGNVAGNQGTTTEGQP